MNNIPLFPPPPPPPLSQNLFSDFDSINEDNNSIESSENDIEVKDLIIDENEKNNVDYLCPICKSFMIPDECIELTCGHLFCKSCINNVNNNLSLSAKCPLCNKKSNSFNYIKYSNKFAYKILSGIKIRCPHEDCQEEIYAGNLKDHSKKCQFVKIDCPYCDEKNIYRKDYKNHLLENINDHFIKLIEEVEDLKKKLDKKNN